MKVSQLVFSQLRCLAAPSAAPRCAAQRNLANRFGVRCYSNSKKTSAPKIHAAAKKSRPVAVNPAPKYSPNQPWKPTVQRGPPENVLIYHAGTGRIVFLGMLRTATIFVCGVSTMIIAPAFFADDFPWYLAPMSMMPR